MAKGDDRVPVMDRAYTTVQGYERLKFFAEKGIGPHLCFGCQETMTNPWENLGKVDFLVHHDEGRELVAMHRACHAILHRPAKGCRWTSEQRERQSNRVLGSKHSAEHNAKIGEGMRRAYAEGKR